MLTDVTLGDNPIHRMIAEINGAPTEYVRLQKGVYLSGHWNFGDDIVGEVNEYPEFSPGSAEFIQALHKRDPEKHDPYTGPSPEVLESLNKFSTIARDEYEGRFYMSMYGIVDSAKQLLSLYDFEADPRNLVISVVCIKRENQSPDGGWRYHKWGTYYGTQKPEYEYLYDDKHIDEVFTFHVYEVL